MRFLRLIFIYRFGLFIALLPGVRPGFDASCLKILFGFPRFIPIADGVLSTDVGVCIAESEQQLLRCHAFLAG